MSFIGFFLTSQQYHNTRVHLNRNDFKEILNIAAQVLRYSGLLGDMSESNAVCGIAQHKSRTSYYSRK